MKDELPEKRYLELAEKWLNGTITPEEEKEYAAWYNTIPPDAYLDVPASISANQEEHRLLLLAKIKDKMEGRVVSMRKRNVWRVAAAAVIIGLIGFGYFLYHNTNKPQKSIAAGLRKNDIVPGTNGAILKLANGKTIVLDTARNGALAQSNAATIIKGNGNILFSAAAANTAIEYNELITPRASQQQITLSDGTKVWLNATSSIRFPTVFVNKERIVEITGEAYFEVAKDRSKPFVVKVNHAEIQVLGTHFNVMAYADESSLQTTLLEGSVQFKNGNKVVQLKPGQQSQLQANGEIKLVKDADLELATAWKNGLQAFSNADIKTVMRELQRWYDVDVSYTGEIPQATFSGEIPRNASLSELLKVFEASQVHFTIDQEHKKLTVTP